MNEASWMHQNNTYFRKKKHDKLFQCNQALIILANFNIEIATLWAYICFTYIYAFWAVMEPLQNIRVNEYSYECFIRIFFGDGAPSASGSSIVFSETKKILLLGIVVFFDALPNSTWWITIITASCWASITKPRRELTKTLVQTAIFMKLIFSKVCANNSLFYVITSATANVKCFPMHLSKTMPLICSCPSATTSDVLHTWDP